jgi:hypothetical protein
MLNTTLAFVAREFQSRFSIHQVWIPVRTFFSRAWHSNRRIAGTTDMETPTWNDEMRKDSSVSGAQMMMSFVFTHPYMQEATAWHARLEVLKKKLKRPLASKRTVFHGFWPNCECEECAYLAAELNCRRAAAYARAQEPLPPAERMVVTTHPDYVPLKLLRQSVGLLKLSKPAAILFRQMILTPECFGVDETAKFLKECSVDPRDFIILDSFIER